MNLEVGMYVRFKPELKEKICKIKEFKIDGFIVLIDNVEYWFEERDVLKASYKIIDLIELGDILKVIYDNKEYICKVVNVLGNKGVQINSDLSVSLGCVEIKSIVTKEQFELMSYKVGENHGSN